MVYSSSIHLINRESLKLENCFVFHRFVSNRRITKAFPRKLELHEFSSYIMFHMLIISEVDPLIERASRHHILSAKANTTFDFFGSGTFTFQHHYKRILMISHSMFVVTMHSILSILPSCISSFFAFLRSIHESETSYSGMLVLPQHRQICTHLFQFTFYSHTIYLN